MLRTKSIPLAEPIQFNGQSVSEIIIREAPFDAIILHGEPFTFARTPEGAVVAIDNGEALSAYVDVCLVNVPREAIQEIGTAKTAEVVDALRGFFRSGTATTTEPRDDGSTTSLTTSSDPAG